MERAHLSVRSERLESGYQGKWASVLGFTENHRHLDINMETHITTLAKLFRQDPTGKEALTGKSVTDYKPDNSEP